MKVYVSKSVATTEVMFEGTFKGQYESNASFFSLSLSQKLFLQL